MNGSSGNSKWSWSGALRLTAEVSAVASVVAFVLSCVINGIVFAKWGHDFLQLASPSDVVMSGLRILSAIAIPIGVAVTLAWIGVMGLQRATGLTALAEKVPPKYAKLREFLGALAGGFIGMVGVAWMILIVLLAFRDVYFSSDVKLGAGLFLILAGMAGATERFAENRTKETITFLIFFWLFLFASVASGTLATGRWLGARIDAQAAKGFHPQYIGVALNGQDVCLGRSRLLWSGSQSDLIECERPGQPRIVIVLRGSENVTYVPRFPRQ